MSTSPIDPERAPVRPRVMTDGSVPTLLEDAIYDLLTVGRAFEVSLCGRGGAGKSTALRHLAAVFSGDDRVRLVDEDDAPEAGDGLRVTIFARVLGVRGAVHLRLAPWSDDEVLEYLLARHPERVAATFDRWRASGDDLAELREWPAACAAVLDILAERDDLTDPIAALTVLAAEEVERRPSEALRAAASRSFRDAGVARLAASWPLATSETVRAVLAAPALLDDIESGADSDPMQPLTRPRLLRVAARMLRDSPGRPLRFAELLGTRDEANDAALLSLLAAAFPGFRPAQNLPHGLPRAWAPGVDLRERTIGGSLKRAHLAAADLRGARLDGCDGSRVDLRGARLKGATFLRADLSGADLAGADARGLDAKDAMLWFAILLGTRLDDACLEGSVLAYAGLAGASLRGANLTRAVLSMARIGDAVLRGACLADAKLNECDLRRADLSDAILDGATMIGVNLEAVEFPGLRAARADLRNARLTGSRLRGARLCGAQLGEAELAEIDWEDADLRDADLRGATFHMGSSRSGLLSSPIACEGSRTGYYTDEATEDAFVAPEDVRKANLRGADLRGARIEGTDFYLVDLRGARLDVRQLEWVRRCKAILDRE